jgi:hypothetical protein
MWVWEGGWEGWRDMGGLDERTLDTHLEHLLQFIRKKCNNEKQYCTP